MEQQQQNGEPQLCQKGCGFFANVGCGGLCSKCTKEAAVQAAATSSPSPALLHATPAPAPAVEPLLAKPTQEAPVSSPSPAAEVASGSGQSLAASDPSADSKPKTRCAECKKKVGLTGFTCKCGGLFCGSHRYAENHCCPFDYKSAHAAKLQASNPVVQASKVQKI